MFCVITPDKKKEPYWLLTLFEINNADAEMMRKYDSSQPKFFTYKNIPTLTYGFLFQEGYSSHLGCDVINFLFSSSLNMM